MSRNNFLVMRTSKILQHFALNINCSLAYKFKDALNFNKMLWLRLAKPKRRINRLEFSVEVSTMKWIKWSRQGKREEKYFIDRLSFNVCTVFNELWNEMFDNSIDIDAPEKKSLFIWLFTWSLNLVHFKEWWKHWDHQNQKSWKMNTKSLMKH